MKKQSYVVRRVVHLRDVQEFEVRHAVDASDAQEQARALIAASSIDKPGIIEGIRQTTCEIVDAGESAEWNVRQLK